MEKLTNRIDFLLDNPKKVLISDIPLLQNEVKKHPYFYSLHALLLFGLRQENHPSFEDNLKTTSLYSPNRVDLYNYIMSVKNTDSIIEERKVAVYDTEKSKVLSPLIEEIKPIVELQKEAEIEAIIETKIPVEVKPIETELETKPIEVEIKSEIIVEEEIEVKTEANVIETITETEVDKVKAESEEIFEIKEQDIIQEEIEAETETIATESLIEPEIKEVEAKPEPEEFFEIKGEEIIEEETISTPIDQNKTLTFTEWLSKNKKQPKKEELNERDIKYKLINDFLEKPPKMTPKKDAETFNYSEEINSAGREFSDLMTETLAQIYTEQKKYDKAIRAYKILSLKYPEKNTYFASRISEIENLKSSK